MSCRLKALPRLLPILPSSMVKNAPCTQYLENGFLPVAASLWAISFGWWILFKSSPPAWISSWSPKYFILIAEHSMCQPGKPTPQGLSHSISRFSPLGENFQRAKSRGSFFWGFTSTLAPAFISSKFAIGIARPLVGGHLKINSVVNPVDKTGLLDLPDELDLLLDMIGGLAK